MACWDLMKEPILFLIIEWLLMISNSGQYKCKKGIGYCFMPVGAHCCSQLLVNGFELYLNPILYKMDWFSFCGMAYHLVCC